MNFLLVEAHPGLCEDLATTLRQSFARATLVTASDVESVAAAVRHAPFDAVLLGLSGREGLQVLAGLGRGTGRSPIVVLSSSEQIGEVGRAFSLGARGFISKSADPRILIAAIHLVIEGGLYIPPIVLAALDAGVAPRPSSPPQFRSLVGPSRLTPKQTEILALMASGARNGAIAAALKVSEKTVKTHVTAILKAFDVVNRREAVSLAQAAGLV